jgi:hypothetical protein
MKDHVYGIARADFGRHLDIGNWADSGLKLKSNVSASIITEVERNLINVSDGNSAKVNYGRTDNDNRRVDVPNNRARYPKHARQCEN